MQHARQHGFHVEASVEAILELGAVAVHILGVAEGVVGAGEGRFEVAQQHVDRGELRHLRAGRFAVQVWQHQDALVLGAGFGHGHEAAQAVRDRAHRPSNHEGDSWGDLQAVGRETGSLI